jgi:hypothetical protein
MSSRQTVSQFASTKKTPEQASKYSPLFIIYQLVVQFISILLTIKMKTAVVLLIFVVALLAICHVADAQVPACKCHEIKKT